MRIRRYADRPPNECPECATVLGNTDRSIYIRTDEDEALRILAVLQRSIIVRIADQKPRRLHVDGTYTPRLDILQGKGDYWYSGTGLRLEATRITWGDA